MQPRWVQTPTRTSHSGLNSRFASVAGAFSVEIGVARERIGQFGQRDGAGLRDFLRRAPADEQRMAAPGEHDLLAGLDRRNVGFDRAQRQRRWRGIHLVDERPGSQRYADGPDGPRCNVKKVAPVGLGRCHVCHEFTFYAAGASTDRIECGAPSVTVPRRTPELRGKIEGQVQRVMRHDDA